MSTPHFGLSCRVVRKSKNWNARSAHHFRASSRQLGSSERRLFRQRGPAQSVIAPRSQTEAISQQVTAADIISLAGLQTGSISRREFVRCRFPCRLFTLPLSIFRQGRLAEEGRPRPRRVVDTSHRNQAYKHAKQKFQQNPPPPSFMSRVGGRSVDAGAAWQG